MLDRSGVHIGGVLSDGFGRNGRRILDGLARGLGHEAILASLSHHVAHKLGRDDLKGIQLAQLIGSNGTL